MHAIGTGMHWCRLVKNIGWANQNIGEQKVVKSYKSMGVSRLLGATWARVFAYAGTQTRVSQTTFYALKSVDIDACQHRVGTIEARTDHEAGNGLSHLSDYSHRLMHMLNII